MNIRQSLIDSLNAIKEQDEKINQLYKMGVDITNMDRPATYKLIELIALNLDCSDDDVSWWLFENVEKIYYSTETNEPVANLESADDFVDYYLDNKNNSNQSIIDSLKSIDNSSCPPTLKDQLDKLINKLEKSL